MCVASRYEDDECQARGGKELLVGVAVMEPVNAMVATEGGCSVLYR